MGPVLLLGGVVMLVLGGAGLLASGGAAYSRLRTTRPIWHVLQVAVGVLLLSAGLALVLGP